MQTWFDLVTISTALIAIWYTIRESRRNNSVVLKVIDCQASGQQSITENNCQLFYSIRIIIRNCGISLHQPRADVSFLEADGSGRINLSLERLQRSSDRDELAKGMIVEFGLKSYEFDEHYLGVLKRLRHSGWKRVDLRIYSQDYLAVSLRIGSLSDRLKQRWNRLAFRFNSLFTRKVGKNEKSLDVIKTYELLPKPVTLSDHLVDFINWSTNESQSTVD